AVAVAESAAPVRAAAPQAWQEVVALAHGRDPLLHAHLLHDVHPVRLAAGRIEIRVSPRAPRDLAARLTRLLEDTAGGRWLVSLSNEAGQATLAERARDAEAQRRAEAQQHPLVQAILNAFPGAVMQEVRDDSLDPYGLPPPAAASAVPEDDEGREFAPPDAEPYEPQEEDE
ncbi:MAG: DNA polymerase III subunit gamma/tau, partial [Acetobacteraceae bacterium]|nr:DNA polymerase III subunit gamma/tau [Acetobacteraceae bacterium]